jgi:eukaryotic-like serine/threonine-protein kinase
MSLRKRMKIENGSIINQYKIISAIGKGGMGEVFLAQDTKLDRKVAIKFLNEEFSRDADKLNRFVQEAKAVSALNHPNILIVHEIGESADSNYIVTEFIEGRTLRESLSPKQTISLNQILKIGVQVAEALSAAHSAGIVHRDIKPENIMIRQDGYAKVLDFGLAKLTEQKPKDEVLSEDTTKGLVKTNPGMVMGTVSYMSPEQARGKETDARTDIWSLGVVLYEMLSGKVPFMGETINHTIVSILEKEPLLLENIPDELQRIVRKALTKDKEMRYQTARDLLIDLKNLRRSLDIQGELERSVIPNREANTESLGENATQIYSGKSIEETQGAESRATQNVTTSSSLEYAVTQAKSHKFVTAVVGIILLGTISAIAYFSFFAKSDTGQIDSIAVLPFQNASGDPNVEYLSDGIAESLINSLTQLQQLKVIARSTAFRFKGKDIDPQAVGRELNVKAVLMGRVRQVGDRLNIQVDLIDAATGAQVWGEEYERSVSEALSIKQAIAREVTEKLRLRLSGEQQQQLVRRETSNPEAFQFYLRGRFYWNKRTADGVKKAIAEFQQAIERDPNFALGYVGLADSYGVLEEYTGAPAGETLPKARAAVDRALQIDDSLAEAHTTLAFIHQQQWRWAEAEQEYKRAIALNRNYPTAHHWFGIYFRIKRQFDDSQREIKRAQELDPLSPIISNNVAMTYLVKNDINAAIQQWQRMIELDPNYPAARAFLGLSRLKQERYEEAHTEIQKAVELSGRASLYLRDLGYFYAVTGRRGEALQILKELEERYARRETIGQYLAAVYAGLGDRDQAFEWLERDFRERSGVLPHITWWFYFDDLRSDPRYADLVRRMGLEP